MSSSSQSQACCTGRAFIKALGTAAGSRDKLIDAQAECDWQRHPTQFGKCSHREPFLITTTYRDNCAIAIYIDQRYTGFLRVKGKLMI
ncbi:MAG: hypothetical protein SAK29_07985 [Scytonema sp. PMC 1069.18]|nr:hypothetical protein [Scytonema sp. PMC 1069.18]MEC4888103.1 hypothetical protein [Scytonema sp. PMC 1070.18]